MRKNVMRHLCASAIASGLIAISTPAAAADYLPVGPQSNVPISTVTGGGWTLCYQSTFATPFGTSASTTLAGCGGDLLLLAGRATGSDTLLELAYASKADALFDTGAADNDIFHNANGSDWFYADNWSWGFKTPGTDFTKNQCDTTPPNGNVCLHTFDWVGGYSINTTGGLNGSNAYERLVFTAFSGGAVPEPSTWAMMLLGFGGIGFAMRRRRKLPLAQLA
jgi:hypothetical protein